MAFDFDADYNSAASKPVSKKVESTSTNIRATVRLKIGDIEADVPVSLDLGNAVTYGNTWVDRMTEDQLAGQALGTYLVEQIKGLETNDKTSINALPNIQADLLVWKGEDRASSSENNQKKLQKLLASLPK